MDKVDIRLPQQPKQGSSNLPKNAEERAVALVDLMERLAALLDRETAAVRSNRMADYAALIKDKQPVGLVVEEMGRLLRIDRAGLASLPPQLKAQLRAANHALMQALGDNVEALRRRGNAQGLLVETIVGAINCNRQHNHTSYGPEAAGYASPIGRRRGYFAPAHGPSTSATLNAHL